MGQRAADIGGKLSFFARCSAQNILHKITEGAKLVPFKFGGADPQAFAQHGFQRGGVRHRKAARARSAVYGSKAVGGIGRFAQHLQDGGAYPALLRLPAKRAVQIQRSGGRGGHSGCRRRVGRHLQKGKYRGQGGAGGRSILRMGGAGPAQPEVAACHGQRLVKADALTQELVFKTVRQLGTQPQHGIAIGVVQKPLVAGRLGELPFCQTDHKDRVGFRQAHTSGRGHDDAVQTLRDMPQIGGAQQQGEQLGVVSRGKGFVPQQQRQLV